MSTKDFIETIIEAYGGRERYSKLSSIDVKMDFTGATLGLKGRATHLSPTASVSTKEQKVVYRGAGGPSGEAWVFTPAKIYKEKPDGTILDFRDNPRARFADHKLQTPWDDFHFVYFVGYALWQYINFPYLLARPDVSVRELNAHQEFGDTHRVLEVSYPAQSVLATHNQVQKYYFNDKLELVRHDYAPDVLGGALAAHYTMDNVVVGGMKFPTMRRVVSIDSNQKPMHNGPIPTLINLVFRKIELKQDAGEGDTKNVDVWELTDAPPV